MAPRKSIAAKASPKSGVKKTATKKEASKATSKHTKSEAHEDGEVDHDAPNGKVPPSKKSASAKHSRNNSAASASKEKASAKATHKVSPKVNGTKRKAHEEAAHEADEAHERPIKKPRTIAAPKKRVVAGEPQKKLGKPINTIPTQRLDVFVFGEGTSGELGLGSKKYDGKKPIDVKRPRINHNLDADKVGVVQIACGGMHVVALTHDNRILTWGVNDQKALGRDTTWEGGTRDVDDESDDEDDDDTGMNPLESTPGDVDMSAFIPGTKIAQVAACDSASFALTEDGSVYGWGTFRGSDGIIGFSESVRIQPTPVLIHELKNITSLACGSNHVLAMDKDGKVFSWGSGGQFQLGRRPITRHGGVQAGLKPEACGRFSKRQHAINIAAGSYHSFYCDNHGKVWAWGLNNYSQTGHSDLQGENEAMVLVPTVVASLEDQHVSQVAGGLHHSVARTEDGALLTWGRIDGHQVGHKTGVFNEDNTVFDENKKPRILTVPAAVPNIHAAFVAAGSDTSFALDSEGKVYSWGFSANYQTGQGTTDDVDVPTVIDNTAVRGRKLVWAGAGGQYSVVAAAAHNDSLRNGH